MRALRGVGEQPGDSALDVTLVLQERVGALLRIKAHANQRIQALRRACSSLLAAAPGNTQPGCVSKLAALQQHQVCIKQLDRARAYRFAAPSPSFSFAGARLRFCGAAAAAGASCGSICASDVHTVHQGTRSQQSWCTARTCAVAAGGTAPPAPLAGEALSSACRRVCSAHSSARRWLPDSASAGAVMMASLSFARAALAGLLLARWPPACACRSSLAVACAALTGDGSTNASMYALLRPYLAARHASHVYAGNAALAQANGSRQAGWPVARAFSRSRDASTP